MVKDFFYRRRIKPLIDWLFSITLLFAISPLLLLIVVILSISFSGKPFFTQVRIGENEKPFWLLKFRSMKDVTDVMVTDNDRLGWIGNFMRKSSLDELPQLINVLKGDMSIVGPRPLLVDYLPYYNQMERKRHLLKPGITGLAQVNGRNRIGWKDRMILDVFYVENISFWLDLKVLGKTMVEVFKMGYVNFSKIEKQNFIEYASKR